MYRRVWQVGLAALVFVAGCSDGSDKTGDDGKDLKPADHASLDRSGVDGQRGADAREVIIKKEDLRHLPDVSPEIHKPAEVKETTLFEEKPACDVEPLGFGCPCQNNTQCVSGYCVESSAGKICTEECLTECPDGYVCQEAPGTGTDLTYVCVPQFIDLCRPCKSNLECQQGGFAPGNFCVSFAEYGDFCGTPCAVTEDCPEGYECRDAQVMGTMALQCVPLNDKCECTERFIKAAAGTNCETLNEFGSCPGERYCTDGGLQDCDATPAAEEVCDGQDNDCDNLADEDADLCGGGKDCKCDGDDCACVCPEGLTDCGDGICIDLLSEVANCKACGQPCEAPNIETYVCQGGVCKIVKCLAGFENFNGTYDDGCECEIQPEICDGVDNDCDGAVDEGEEACPGQEDCFGTCVDGVCECSAGCDFCEGFCVPWLMYFEDPENCGYCGNKCALNKTTAYGCEGGNCYPLGCEPGWADCDGVWPNGCEWEILQEECNCVDDDCDGDVDEQPLAGCPPPKSCVDCFCQCPKDDPNIMDCGDAGCRDITTDPEHCGWCDNDCANMQWPSVKQYGCDMMQCTILGCDAPFFDTNGMPWDGCECEQTTQVELCDVMDNNCDGEIDEPPLSDCKPPLVCEFGFCACPLDQSNLQECMPGQCIDVFTNPKHCGFCDNGCADLGWENVMQYGCDTGMCNILACQPPWVDVNGMEFDGCECEKTSGMETCDFLDNNCNGEFDEKPNNCIPPMICLAGGCVCPPDQPSMQECGDGKCTDTSVSTSHCGFCDNLCDLDNLAFQKCEGGQCVVAACMPKFKDCNGQPFDGCEFEIKPEECNGFDDDCDGEIDEGAMGIGQPCDTGLPGLCDKGIQFCEGGGLKCKPNIQPGQYEEVCDDKDNNCDGSVDEGNPGGGGPCNVQDKQGECKTGILECQAGKPFCQQTTFPQEEFCDGKDNDCDGQVDGMSEDCFTMCGDGKKTCNNGVWGQCSAMAPKLCKNYDNCQMEDMCVLQCPSAPMETCNSMDDNCDGQIDETFQCKVGDFQDQSCGNCGTQSRNCTGNCTWGNWGQCQGQGQCSPNQSKIEGTCGNCGQQKWVCSSGCFWQQDQCMGQGQCSPGDSKKEGSCGKCGKYLYNCTGSCNWSQAGCVDEGVCSLGQTKYDGSCGNCGDQQYKCGGSCQWEKDSCKNQGVCSQGSTKYEGSCGNCGENKYSCNSSCNWQKQSGCYDQGTCSPNTTKYEGSCGNCGENKYSCNSSCNWQKQSGCYNQGVCSPGSVDWCSGCSAKKCYSNCSWSSCSSSNACQKYNTEMSCGCDDACPGWGDCCYNARDYCGIPTCAGHCGEEFPGCDCDWNCWMTSCCEDKGDEC